jgi:phage-related tail fiber protein
MTQEYTPVQWVDETPSEPGTVINKARLDQMQTAHHYADGFEEVDTVPTADPQVTYHKVVYCTADSTFYRWDGSQWTKDIDDDTKALLLAHEADHSNPHVVTKAQVGLGNADNTSDLDKPVSVAQQAALDAKVDDSQIVTTWSVPLSDDNIPGEKLVKDSLDAKVDDTQIVTSWGSPLSDDRIPSEKLVKDTFAQYGIAITGAATSILTSDLTPEMAMVSDENGKVAVSTVTAQELAYLSGVSGNVQDQIDGKVDKNVAITGATKCKITYDAKGLVTAGGDLVASDIPTIAVSQVSGLQGDLDGKVDKITPSPAGTYYKVTVNAQGQVTSGSSPTTLSGYGITDAVQANAAITGATKTKITYDAKGLVTAGSDLAEGDIPSLSISKISGLQTALDAKMDDTQLVSSWQGTPDNTHVASEKLTKDALDGKAPTDHASSSATYGAGDATHYGHVIVDASMNAGSDNPVRNSTVVSFVNSSIATATANFRGTYDAISDLGFTSAQVDLWTDPPSSSVESDVSNAIKAKLLADGITPTNNDYVFVSVNMSGTVDVDFYWRFKYDGTDWLYEYTLNNSSFTQAQWDTINALITNTTVDPNDPSNTPYQGIDVKDILNHIASAANPHSVTKAQVGLGNVDNYGSVSSWQGTPDNTHIPTEKLVKDSLDGKVDKLVTKPTAGTYTSVTINAEGQVTGGSNPTTLAGYGITDAVNTTGDQTGIAGMKEWINTPTFKHTDGTSANIILQRNGGDASTATTNATVTLKTNAGDRGYVNNWEDASAIHTQLSAKGNSTHSIEVSSDKSANSGWVTAPYRTSGITVNDVLTAGNGVTLGTDQTITGEKMHKKRIVMVADGTDPYFQMISTYPRILGQNPTDLSATDGILLQNYGIDGTGLAYYQQDVFRRGSTGYTELYHYLKNKNGVITYSALYMGDNNIAWMSAPYRAYSSANVNDVVTIGSLASNPDVVHTTGNESVNGEKSFGNTLKVKTTWITWSSTANEPGGQSISFIDNAGVELVAIFPYISSGTCHLGARYRNSDGTTGYATVF